MLVYPRVIQPSNDAAPFKYWNTWIRKYHITYLVCIWHDLCFPAILDDLRVLSTDISRVHGFSWYTPWCHMMSVWLSMLSVGSISPLFPLIFPVLGPGRRGWRPKAESRRWGDGKFIGNGRNSKTAPQHGPENHLLIRKSSASYLREGLC